MASTYIAASFMEPTFDDACNHTLSRNFNGKLLFPSLIPITDNMHDWIEQFRNEESPPPVTDGAVNKNCISGLNNSNSVNVLKVNEGFNTQLCMHLQNYSSEDDIDVANYSERLYNQRDMYINHNSYLKAQVPSSFYPLSRQIQMVSPNYRNFAKNEERKFVDFYINPIELNFLPKELWLTQKVTIRSVFQNFFKARSTKNLRFEHKLWNALALSKRYPELIPFLGVFWVSKNLIKVNRDIFGALINVSKPAAALFNNQGSFLTHGFLEITKEKALRKGISPELVEDVDESVVRLFKHSTGMLTADSNKADVSACRWNK